MNQPIIIIGTGSKAKTALEILQANELIVYGFLDEDSSREGDVIGELAILGSQHDPIFLDMIGDKCVAFVALENPSEQQEYIQNWSNKKILPTLNAIHPKAHLASQVTLGEGNMINVFSNIGFDATLGSYNTLAEQVTIGREAQIGNHVNIEAGTIVGERAVIHSGAQIGPGSIILPNTIVNENTLVSAGTILKKS